MKDQKSTSNLHKHTTCCWGIDIIKEAYEAAENKDVGIDDIQKGLVAVKTQKDGSITTAFEWQGTGKHTYSMHPHTYIETQ